jgi:hypothetical protein
MNQNYNVRGKYTLPLVLLSAVLIVAISGGAYLFISADTTNGIIAYTDPPQVVGNCTAADISLVVDTSGSTQPYINDYKTNLSKFIGDTETAVPNTNWTLTTFNSTASIDVPWTKDTSSLLTKINNLTPGGNTATATGIKTATDQGTADSILGTNNSAKIMLIITDGLPNTQLDGTTEAISFPKNSINDAIDQANKARALGYSTMVVDLNSGTTTDPYRDDTIRGLAGTDVPTIAGNVIPATFSNLSSQVNTAFGCVTDILSIEGSVDNDKPKVGSDVNFTITVKDRNSVDQPKATNIIVKNTLPAGLTLKSTDPSTGTFKDSNWTIPELKQGESATLKITATVTDSVVISQLTNTATIVSQDQDDTNKDNNTLAISFTPTKVSSTSTSTNSNTNNNSNTNTQTKSVSVSTTTTPTKTTTKPTTTVKVSDTKTGPDTFVVYLISGLLSLVVLGAGYLFGKKRA